MVTQKQKILDLAQALFAASGKLPTIKDLENEGVSKDTLYPLFGNLSNLYVQCNFPKELLVRNRRKKNISDEEFKEFIDEIKEVTSNGCWITKYRSAILGTNRTQTTYKTKKMRLYQVAFLLYKGPLLASHVIRHPCDNEACFNPAHLLQGSPQQNSQDREQRNRATRRGPKQDFKHGLSDPYDYQRLLAFIKTKVTVTSKNEWLYPTSNPHGYAVLVIKGRGYLLHRLILANKLDCKYEEIDQACHRFQDNNYFSDKPSRNDVNPDHLYNGTRSENAKDSLAYKKGVVITPAIKEEILREAKETDFSRKGAASQFDLRMANKLGVSSSKIQRIRAAAGNTGSNNRPVTLLDENGIVKEKFNSVAKAVEAGYTRASIYDSLNTPTLMKKTWRYT